MKKLAIFAVCAVAFALYAQFGPIVTGGGGGGTYISQIGIVTQSVNNVTGLAFTNAGMIASNQYGIVIIRSNGYPSAFPRLGFGTNWLGPSANDIATGPFIGWDPAHTDDGEIHITSPARISINSGYNRQYKSVIHLGGSGSYRDRVHIQADTDSYNNDYHFATNWHSKPLVFLASSAYGLGAEPGIMGVKPATNGSNMGELRFYSIAPDFRAASVRGTGTPTSAEIVRFGTNGTIEVKGNIWQHELLLNPYFDFAPTSTANRIADNSGGNNAALCLTFTAATDGAVYRVPSWTTQATVICYFQVTGASGNSYLTNRISAFNQDMSAGTAHVFGWADIYGNHADEGAAKNVNANMASLLKTNTISWGATSSEFVNKFINIAFVRTNQTAPVFRFYKAHITLRGNANSYTNYPPER